MQIAKPNIPKCIVLAAGESLRLRPLTLTMPKCLLKIGGKALLEQAIENILTAGIKEIAIVVGYQKEMIQEFVKTRFPRLPIRYVFNPHYATTNNAYSLLLARKFLENKDGNVIHSLVLLDGDILFSPRLLPFLLNNGMEDKIAVRVTGMHALEEIRVKVDDSLNIDRIGKDVPFAETYGESIGIEIFSVETTACMVGTLEYRIRNGAGRTEFYEAAFQEMIDNGSKLKAIDVSAYPAIEIDTVEDLNEAESMKVD